MSFPILARARWEGALVRPGTGGRQPGLEWRFRSLVLGCVFLAGLPAVGGVAGQPEQILAEKTIRGRVALPATPSAVFVDSGSNLWLAFSEGKRVVRHDGWTSATVHAGAPAIRSGSHRPIAQTRDGTIWFATEAGLARYRDGAFILPSPDAPLPRAGVTASAAAPNGHLWVALENGIARVFLGPKGKPLTHRTEQLPFDPPIFDLAVAADGSVLATSRDSIYRFDTSDWERLGKLPRVAERTGQNRIHVDSHGGVWVYNLAAAPSADEVVLTRYRNGGVSQYSGEAGLDSVSAVLDRPGGSLLVGAESGVRRLRDKRWLPWGRDMDLASTSLLAIVQSPDRALWFLTPHAAIRHASHDADPPRLWAASKWPTALRTSRMRLAVEAADRWGMSEPVTLELSLDGEAPHEHPPSEPIILRGLRGGSHTLVVRAVDAVGNRQPEPLVHGFRVRPALWERTSPKTLRGMALVSIFCIAIPSIIYALYKHRRLKHSLEQLRLANERLQESDTMKSDLVANVSHELRTPLTAIKGFVDNLIDGIGGPVTEKQVRSLQRIKVNSDRLGRLINDLLDLRRIEQGRLELHRTAIDLQEVAAGTIAALHPRAREKNIRVTLEVADGCSRVWADRDRIAQVYTNIIGNALKFTPDNGKIEIVIRPEGTKWVYSAVTDTGPGISPNDQRRVFNRFHQVTGKGADKAEGAGLGLGICRDLVRLNGGTIGVESELGKGSTFYFRLPVLESPRGASRNE